MNGVESVEVLHSRTPVINRDAVLRDDKKYWMLRRTQDIILSILALAVLWPFMLIVAIVIMCLASSLYFTANLGVSTYDAVSLVISEKWNPLPFKYCRIIGDLICVILGVALFLMSGQPMSGLAAVVGVGTIVTAFFMGPLIAYFNVHVAQPLLKK